MLNTLLRSGAWILDRVLGDLRDAGNPQISDLKSRRWFQHCACLRSALSIPVGGA